MKNEMKIIKKTTDHENTGYQVFTAEITHTNV